MAQCKYCSKRGFFLSTDSIGLCSVCAVAFRMEVAQKALLIVESGRLVEESKNLPTRISRCNLVIQLASDLIKYEERGIWNLEFSPRSLVRTFSARKDELYLEDATSVAQATVKKAQVSTSAKSATNLLGKAVVKIEGYYGDVVNKAPFHQLCDSLRAEAHKLQLYEFIQSAKKAEFKGNAKKALDQFQEALFFLMNDDIPDEKQEKAITWLKSKITELKRK